MTLQLDNSGASGIYSETQQIQFSLRVVSKLPFFVYVYFSHIKLAILLTISENDDVITILILIIYITRTKLKKVLNAKQAGTR